MRPSFGTSSLCFERHTLKLDFAIYINSNEVKINKVKFFIVSVFWSIFANVINYRVKMMI